MKKGTRRFLSLLLALAMILSHAHISYAADHDAHTHEDAAAEEAAPENGTKELEMEDLDPSSLGIRKLGEITEEHGDEAEISLTPDLSLNQTIRVSIFLDGKGTVDAGFETKGIAADPAAISYRNQLKAQQETGQPPLSVQLRLFSARRPAGEGFLPPAYVSCLALGPRRVCSRYMSGFPKHIR